MSLYGGKGLTNLIWYKVNPLPNDKTLDQSKLKNIADDIRRVTQKLSCYCFRESRKHHGKRKKMLVTSIFAVFSKCFQKADF